MDVLDGEAAVRLYRRATRGVPYSRAHRSQAQTYTYLLGGTSPPTNTQYWHEATTADTAVIITAAAVALLSLTALP